MQTSIDYIIEQLEENGLFFRGTNNELNISINANDYLDLKRLAKEMEKQMVIDIVEKSRATGLTAEYLLLTYGSKGSDDQFVDTNKMVSSQTDENGKPLTYWGGLDTSSQTTSDKWKEYQDWLNEVPEISDEEITKLANEHILYNDYKRQWVIEGMKLYREHLKQK